MGSKERFDDKGREKVQCRECNGWFHRLDVHAPSKHDMKVAEYLEKYPGAPTISEAARKQAKKSQQSPSKGKKEAAPVVGDDDKLFKFGVARLRMREGLSRADAAYIPRHDEKWEPGENEQRQLEELAMAMEDDDNCLIVGPHGIGKSTLVIELAAICSQPLRRVNMDGDVRRADFVGEKVVEVDEATGQTVTRWVDGILVDAAIKGHWLLIDELDAMPAHIAFVMQGVLEAANRNLVLMGDGGRKVKFHDDFRIIATANTLGHGDDSGMYAGTTVMNEAFLDRWGVTISAGYPTEETEVSILTGRTGIDPKVAKKMVAVAVKVREAVRNETCFSTVSPRRLIDWAGKYVRLDDARRSARLTILNKMGGDDAKFVAGLIQRYFGGDVG